MRSLALATLLSTLSLAGVVHAQQAPAAQAAKQLGRRVLSKDWKAPAGGKVKVAFFDADSTLRESISGNVSASHPTDVRILPGVISKIKALNAQGYLVAIVSNQGGVGKAITLEHADAALQYTAHLIAQGGGRIDYYDFAEHWDQDRKPNIGMATRLELKLQQEHGLTLDKGASIMVGDSGYKATDTRPDGKPGTSFSNADRLFAENYKIPFLEAPHYFVGPLTPKQ